MFVQNIKNVDNIGKVKKAKKKPVDGEFSVFLDDAEDESKAVNEVYSTPSVSSMIFLQDVNSEQNIAQSNYERGQDLLDGLDTYRKAILSGKPTANLDKVAEQLKSQRTKSHDPILESLIDEIELRAAVEAAKRENEI